MKRSSVFLSAAMLAVLLLLTTARTAGAQPSSSPLADDDGGPKVYVTGAVVCPRVLHYKEMLTVTQAVAAARGLRPDAKRERVRIIRTDPAGTLAPVIIPIDLKAIGKRRAPDVPLQPYDIVDVGGTRVRPRHYGPLLTLKTPVRVIR